MQQLFAFLLVRHPERDWEVISFRNLDDLLDAWKKNSGSQAVGIVHVGFWRPNSEAFNKVADLNPGRVFLTEAARCALPRDFHCASAPRGSVEGLAIYEALSGWGCEGGRFFERQDSFVSEQSVKGSDVTDRPAIPDLLQSSWLSAAMNDQRDLWNAAMEAGIVDDASYQELEASLPSRIRTKMGAFRFLKLAGTTVSERTILGSLQFAPPWLLNLEVKSLNLSTRSLNRFAAEKILTLADIARVGESELYKMQNLGMKSVREIAIQILNAFKNGSDYCAAFGVTKRSISLDKSLSAESAILDHFATLSEKDGLGFGKERTFGEALKNALLLLDERAAKVLRFRMGLEGEKRTLDGVGAILSVTRERVRQIEARASRRIAERMPVWRKEMESRLRRIFESREDPVPIVGLEIFDSWFVGVSETEGAFNFALEHFSDCQKFWPLKVEEQTYVSGLNPEGWTEALRRAKALLIGLAEEGSPMPETSVRTLVDGLLVGKGQELRPLLWKISTLQAHFSADQTGQRTLISFGLGAENVVEAILSEADRPLHYTEIAKLSKARGKELDVRRAQNAAAAVGFLFARGTYGVKKHIPMSEAEIQLAIAEVEDMLAESGSRQWHISEICNELEDRGLEYDGRLSKYVLNTVLRSSAHLSYLGRMIWAMKSDEAHKSSDRIEVWQAVASMLDASGGPMSTEELRESLSQDRGLGSTFQIHQVDPVIRVGKGVWGLLWRDVPFGEEGAKAVVSEMEGVMREMGKGLHTTEILEALKNSPELTAGVNDPTLLVALAQRSGRIKAGYGGYIYPCDWEGPRRLRIVEAVEMAIGEREGSVSEISRRASKHLGRELTNLQVSGLLSSIGAVYDGTEGIWRRPEVEDDRGATEELGDTEETKVPSLASSDSTIGSAQGV